MQQEEFFNNKALVIYHRVDYDGLFGYAIVKKALTEIGNHEVVGFGYNYKDHVEMPNFDDYGTIVMVDITLPSDNMVLLNNKYHDKTYWIDHHITQIKDSEEKGYNTLEGIRDTTKAASKLAWEFYFPNKEIPYAVDLVATNDIWDKNGRYDWENEVQTFQFGLGLTYKMDAELVTSQFDTICENAVSIQDDGRKIKEYEDGLHKSWCDRFSFPVEINGKWKGIAMLSPVFSSKIFQSLSEFDYDCYVVLNKNANQEGVYNVSMYSEKDIDFSCGEYMKTHYNGGGHKGAAGGFLNIEQFTRVLVEHKI